MSDEDFVSDVVDKVKKQGLFDGFRRECLADVDTKPAYQNLQLRVKEAVGKYLHSLKWKSDLNKNQLRENLRRHLNELPMLTNGIDGVVEQVVKPKIQKSLKPQIDRVICEHMNIVYEQWLSDQNDAQKKKLAKLEETVIPPPVISSHLASAPPLSFPSAMTATVPPVLTSAPRPIVDDLQLPPPPPPSFEEPNDSTSSPRDPPPPPPPLPSDASEDESSVPAPPPDVYHSLSSPPPLPPDDDDDEESEAALPPKLEETGLGEEGCNREDDVFEGMESSPCIKTCPDAEDPLDKSNAAETSACESISEKVCGKTGAVCRSSDDGSPNDSFSNDNSFQNSEILNVDGASKEYRFAWNNFNESDLSNISVSSVHTSDLSNFEEDEDLDAGLNDPDQNSSRIRSKDGDMSKDSDSKQSTSIRHSLNESMHGSLDTSNASFNSSGRKRTKKEELKERKMEEKKELKRQRVLNRRYCSEDFMSIFNDKQNLQQKQEAREEATNKEICHLELKFDGEEDIKLDGETNASDLENAYSPYSNISEASSDSVVVLGVEPAKPKKGKKSKSRKRSRSSDGNRRKKKRRRHKSSRRSSRHCSGGDEEIEDTSYHPKQDGIRTKSSVHEFDNNSSKGYPEEELADDYYMDDFCSDATKKKIKKSVDRINFGEAERQAAAFRMTAGSKQLPFSITSPTWQKQTFSSPPRSSRHNFVGQPNFTPMTATTGHKHIRHTPSLYHQQPVHSMHEARTYDRTKHISEPDSYRHSRNVSKKSCHVEGNGDEINADNNGFKRIKRSNDEEKVKHLKLEKSTKLMADELKKDNRQQKRDYIEARNKR